MKNVRVLDCTLRDGGRIIDCAFPDPEIKSISSRLANAKIDIIEMGFIRDWRKVNYKGNSTFFTNADQISPFISKKRDSTMYTAFIDFGMCDIDSLNVYDGSSIDAIRLGFTKKNYEEEYSEVLRWAKVIKEKGYKLFIQGVNSLNYTELELLNIIKMVNDIQPYSFGIVDTYGAMYMDDVDRLFGLIDRNMSPDICINFHSHNNYQLSFAFAQEIIKLSNSGNRQIIIDGTLSGMGKVAGNLNTELIVDYLVRKKNYDYEFDDILDLIDDYIYKYSLDHRWGYSSAALMAGIYKSHPNNVIYLTEKFRLDTKDIGHLLSMIDVNLRQRYDYDNIERIYTEYIAEKINDHDCIESLKEKMKNKDILVLVPGNSLNTYKKNIVQYIKKNKPIVISVNFISDVNNSFAFFANLKRYNRLKDKKTMSTGKNIIVSSNIKSNNKTDFVVDYYSLINRNYKYFENTTMMLLNLLKRVNPKRITMAGFDGFDENSCDNYLDSSFQNDRHIGEFSSLNKEIKQMFDEFVKTIEPKCEIVFITPSIFCNNALIK